MAGSPARSQRTKRPRTRQGPSALHWQTTPLRRSRHPIPDASERQPAPPTTNVHQAQRSCRAARCSPDPAAHARWRQWCVQPHPAVLHTQVRHRLSHPARVMTCDPACHSGSAVGDPTAHKPPAPCNPATCPTANCASFPRQGIRASHLAHQPNTPPIACRCPWHLPAPPPHTRAHPHARSAAPRSLPTRCGNHES